MEKDNLKAREKAKREFNDVVRQVIKLLRQFWGGLTRDILIILFFAIVGDKCQEAWHARASAYGIGLLL